MHVVVTGSSGVLGAEASQVLAARRENRVIGYDRAEGGLVDVETRRLDLLETSPDFRWPAETEAVLHLAGTWSPVEPSAASLALQLRTNVELVARALAACGRGVRRFVYVSSMSVYGAASPVPFRETDPPRPDTFYGSTKWLGEQVCRVAAEARPDLALVILRLAQVYGPGTPPRVVIYDFIDQALRTGQIWVECVPDLRRDHIYLSDAAEAMAAALTAAPPGTYNVGAGGHTMSDLVSAIRKASSHSVSVRFGGARGTAKVLDSTKFHGATGFKARMSLHEGVRLEMARRKNELGLA